jgi:hypothetical protein
MPRPDFTERQNARAAIKEMGTNALPELTQMLRCDDSPMRKYIVSWVSNHAWLKSKLNFRPPADEEWRRALDAITCLGPAGQPALADVLPLVTNQNSAVKIKALFALRSIGPETEVVKPIVPTLMQALADQEWTMRLAAIDALAVLRPIPPEAVTAFVRLVNDPNGMVSDAAMKCLVARTNALAIPLLDKQLQNKDKYVVTEAASQIGVFGAAAAASEPHLRELLNDPLFTVREAATNALAAITGHLPSLSAPEETADVTFDFPGMPLQAFLSFYESLAGKKVAVAPPPNPSADLPASLARLLGGKMAMAPPPNPGQMLRVKTPRPLTKTEALTLLDEILREQAGLVIVHGKDGSLTAITKP